MIEAKKTIWRGKLDPLTFTSLYPSRNSHLLRVQVACQWFSKSATQMQSSDFMGLAEIYAIKKFQFGQPRRLSVSAYVSYTYLRINLGARTLVMTALITAKTLRVENDFTEPSLRVLSVLCG